MVKHTYLKNIKLKVSATIHPSCELNLNEEGIVEEKLSLEISGELTDHPDFVFIPEAVESEKVLTETDQPKIEKVDSEKPIEPELIEGSTKVVNKKGFIYKKNAKEVLTWLRYPELDEKDN